MQYTSRYSSPLCNIVLSADDLGLTGLWFEGQKYFPPSLPPEKELPIFSQARTWLDIYFSGKEPSFSLPLHLIGTDFQMEVWQQLLSIPYGHTTTYGSIAKSIARKLGRSSMSAQAVGSAVGHNKLSIIVPCHRVLGSDGSLTGYAGGIDKKIYLLQLEKSPAL